MRIDGIRTIVALYRVSTRAQENKGESLMNQERAVRTWAAEHGIQILQEIRAAESGKSALRLVGAGFQFARRAAYGKLIVDLQKTPRAERPDAVVVDWTDRWSRNTLEFVAIVKAFRELGVKLLAIGDDRDLTDRGSEMELQIRATFAEELLRVTSNKIKENRKFRRESGLWQGGAPPDGYRTHSPECAGLQTVSRDTPEGPKSFSVRACRCPQTVLRQDPKRAPVFRFIWELLERSPKSWEGMVDEVNARGYRKPNGKLFRWNDLYRIGENPHYAGILATDRWEREEYDGSIKRRRQLVEQTLSPSPETIPEPYISIEKFWEIHQRRFAQKTRTLRRSKGGSSSEVTGLVRCPDCGEVMSSFRQLSPKKGGHGNPRRSPRRSYPYMDCPNAVRRSGREITCGNTQRVRADTIGRLLIDHLAQITVMSDEAIERALALRKRSKTEQSALVRERTDLLRTIETSDNARHVLLKNLSAGHITQAEFEREIFTFRIEKNAAETRLRETERELRTRHAKPDFTTARSTISWLSEHWDALTIEERAEALRLLVREVSYQPVSGVHVKNVAVRIYGSAFVESAEQKPKNRRRSAI